MRKSLQDLGRTVSDEQERQLRQLDALATARARLLGAPAPPARRLPRVALAGGLAAVAALALLAWSRRAPALAFEVAGVPGHPDTWLAAPAASPLPLRFSDGTSIDLAPATRARVVNVGSSGAHVVLERGQAQVAVVHRPGARWQVNAGPFEVHVVGTRFEVEWDNSREVFRLAMAEGAVEVKGSCLPSPLRFKAGEAISLGCPARPAHSTLAPASASTPASIAAPPPSAPAPALSASAPPTSAAPARSGAAEGTPRAAASVAPEPPASAPEAPPPAASSPPAAPGWKELAASRRPKDALAAAEALGFDGLCGSLDAGDLVQLGDAARFAGNTGRAVQALTSLRRRFPGDGRSSTAAFTLGRIAFDQRGSFGEAAGWFATYLNEQPGGPLALEATGRLMEARQRSGDATGARHAAQQYLARFPDGPHAPLARKLTEVAPAP